jgi:hypothetical protein
MACTARFVQIRLDPRECVLLHAGLLSFLFHRCIPCASVVLLTGNYELSPSLRATRRVALLPPSPFPCGERQRSTCNVKRSTLRG